MARSVKGSAMRALVVVALSIFISEFMVMILLSFIPHLPVWIEAVVDSLMLIIIVSPLLYLFLFRPFARESRRRTWADIKLLGEKEKAQQYLDVAGVMLLVIGRDGKVELINKKGLEILGSTESEVLGVNWFDNFIPERYRPSVKDVFSMLFAERVDHAEYMESFVLTKDLRERTIAWNNTLLRDFEGNVNAILSSGEDITERKRAEEALHVAHHQLEERVEERTRELKEANETLAREFMEHKRADEALEETELRLSSVTQSANDAIVAADSTDKIISWNKGAERIFGYSPDEVVGRHLTVLMPERYRAAHKLGFNQVIRTGLSKVVGKTLEFEGLKKDGSEFPLELSVATWKTGRGIFFSGIMRDISVRKRIEEEKENIQAQLLHSQKLEAIGRLIVGVAHDFSNIILSIKGYSTASMKGLEEDDPVHKNLEKVQSLVERGSNITHQLLLFGRKQPLVFSEVDINSTIDGLLKMIDNLIRGDIKVIATLEPKLWRVRADRGNIEQVLMNLVVNANDAMAGGGKLTINTANVELDEEACNGIAEARPGRYVSVAVRDTGAGMEKSVADRIFDPFFTTKGQEGSGLGLSVIYGIVNRHEGWINVESEPGKGACFTFYLPALPFAGAVVPASAR